MPDKDYFKNKEERNAYYKFYRRKNSQKLRKYNREWTRAYRLRKKNAKEKSNY